MKRLINTSHLLRLLLTEQTSEVERQGISLKGSKCYLSDLVCQEELLP